MSLKTPRGKFERRDVLLSTVIWRTIEKADTPVASTCRNISARGCRLVIEDARLAPNFDVDLPIHFRIDLSPWKPHRPHARPGASVNKSEDSPLIEGSGEVVWVKREHGEPGAIRLNLGVQFTAVSFQDREKIKAFIASLPEPS